jgi:cytochrome P450
VVIAPFHAAKQDIKLGEYDIPKDSIILIDCKAPCHDGNVWKDPEVFNPERFLGGADQKLPESSFPPYGTGTGSAILSNMNISTVYSDENSGCINVYTK